MVFNNQKGPRSGTINRLDEKTALLIRFASKDPSKSIVAHMFTLLLEDPQGTLIDKKDNKCYREVKQPGNLKPSANIVFLI